jgi:D-alanyl-D-alanine carboxypeptidase
MRGMNSTLLPAALTVLALATSSPVHAQAQDVSDDARARIEERCLDYLWTLHETRSFPGGSAALILPDGSELAFPVGYADVEAEVEMEEGDRLLSGSIGKTYVTAAAHKLMLEGKLSFDRRAIEFLEGEDWFLRVANAEDVTILQLLRHESGIPRYVFHPDFFPACVAEPDKVWTPRELISFIFDDEPMFAAGEGWAYSDTNFIVVGMIIEKVTGKSFYEYVRTEFLEPLGLKDTIPSDSRTIKGLVQGYIVALKSEGMPDRTLQDGVFCINPQFEWCGGGYANTSMDLARWARILYRGEAMEGPYLDTMLDSVPARLGPGMEYGCGVMIAPTELGQRLGHDGIMTGYLATMGYYPEHELAVAFMINTDNERVLGTRATSVAEMLATIAAEELSR